jgi:hypothetical protein
MNGVEYGMARLVYLRDEGEDIEQRMDASFELMLAEYLNGPRSVEDRQALEIQVNAIDNIRCRGEWQAWYYSTRICYELATFFTCLLALPCSIVFMCTGGWRGHEDWRKEHDRPEAWNLDVRAPVANHRRTDDPVAGHRRTDVGHAVHAGVRAMAAVSITLLEPDLSARNARTTIFARLATTEAYTIRRTDLLAWLESAIRWPS